MIEPFEPGLLIPSNSKLSSSITALTGKYIAEIFNPKRRQFNEWIKMLEKDAVANKCSSLKNLRAQISVGEYTHENKEYQKFIRSNFENMSTSFKGVIAELASSMSFGSSFSEVVFANNLPGFRNKWRLKGIYPLDIRRVSVRGHYGKLKDVVFRNQYNNRCIMDYKKVLHVKNISTVPFDQNLIWGIGDCEQAINFYKLRQLCFTELAVAMKNNASAKWWAKTNTTQKTQITDRNEKPVLDPATGKPMLMSKQKAVYLMLKQLEDNDILVTDSDTEIQVLQSKTLESFWQYSLQIIEENMMLSFGIPRQIFREGSSGVGDVGLSQNHKAVLDATIESIVISIRKEMIDKVVKPLLVYNFGETENFGQFDYSVQQSGEAVNAKVSTILSAIASGVFSADDVTIQEVLRKDLGLPPLSDGDKKDAQEQQKVQEWLKYYSNQATIAQAKGQVEQSNMQMGEAPPIAPSYP